MSAPHTPTVIRNTSTGVVSIDWGGPVPPGDELVLMTVSLFCESIDAINIEVSNRRNRTAALGRTCECGGSLVGYDGKGTCGSPARHAEWARTR